MTLSDRWSDALERIRGQGRLRELHLPGGVDFTSNDYLGYATAKGGDALRSAARLNGLALSGTASRLLRGHHAVWEEVETELARWHGAESALMLTSGYAANEGLLATVIEPGDWVASDQLNHASIIDGLRLAGCGKFIYRHLDLNHLETGLQAAARKRSKTQQLFLVTESLFGMEGDLAPLEQMAELAERYDAHLIVDEAHSTGCFGATGSGCVDLAQLRGRVLATVHTGGKALGVCGAYICASSQLRTLLVNRCRHLIFTTALPPVIGAWWMDALQRVQADNEGRAALHRGGALLRAGLGQIAAPILGSHYIVPIVLGSETRAVLVAKHLCEAGWDIRAVRPPSVPAGTARLRLSVHADHTPEILAAVAEAVTEAIARFGPESDER